MGHNRTNKSTGNTLNTNCNGKSKFDFITLFVVFASFFFLQKMQSQDCSVNAGIPETICENNLYYTLSGSVTGQVQDTPLWSQVAGPPVILQDPSDLNSAIFGMQGGESYTFRLSTNCFDGSTQFQDIELTVAPITIAETSADLFSCPDRSGTIEINGNAPENPGEVGTWTFEGNNNAGVIINEPNSPTTTISLLEVYAGTSTLRWTIRGPADVLGQYCESYSEMLVTNYGGRAIVNAGPDQSLDNCYSVSQSTGLNAYFGGSNINGQQGTWSLVTGPSTPVFENRNSNTSKVSNLIEGTYELLWSVDGPCVTGSDTMTITVAEVSQDVTSATTEHRSIRFCDSSFTTTTLSGALPIYTGETVQWAQIEGPGVNAPGTLASISNPTNSATQVANLDGASTYVFSYTIANNTTGCSDSSIVTIAYSIEPISIEVNEGNDMLPPCGETKVSIPFTTTGEANTSYSIINGPADSRMVDSEDFEAIASTPLSLDFDVEGTYTILFRRKVDGSVQQGCQEATAFVNVRISAIPTPANAGTGQSLPCNVIETSLTGNVISSGTSLWSQISGPSNASIIDPYARTTPIRDLNPGTYTFRYSISGGEQCTPAQSDVQITVSSSAIVSINAGADQTVCFGSQAQLGANTPEIGTLEGIWSVNSAPVGTSLSFADINDPNTIVSGFNDPSETYILKWTIRDSNNLNCPLPREDTVIIRTNSMEGPSFANAGADQCLPSGTTSVALSANAPAADETGSWSVVPTTGFSFADNRQFNTTGTISIPGTYTLTWTLDKCQTSSDEVEITVVDSAVAEAGPDRSSCSNQLTMAADASNGSGEWTLVSGLGGVAVDDATSPTATFTFTYSGEYVYQWTVRNGNCSETSDTVKLNIGVPPTVASTGTDQTICNANSIVLDGNEYDANIETGFWSLLTGAPNTPTIANVNDPTSAVTNLVSGTYTFRWTISGDDFCTPTFSDSTFEVYVVANAGPDQQLCESENAVLQATQGSKGTWLQVDGPGMNGNPGTPAFIFQNPANGPRAEVTLTTGSEYVFEFTTVYATCPSTADQVVVTTSNSSSASPNAGENQVICNSGGNTSVTLNGNNAIAAGFDTTLPENEAFWRFASQPSGSVATIGDPNVHNTTLDNLVAPGIYILEWNFSTQNCTDEADVVRIAVFEPYDAIAGPDQPNACAASVNLNAVAPPLGVGEWSLVSDPSGGAIVIESPNSPTSSLSNVTTLGTYVFEWTVTNGAFTSGSCANSTDRVSVTFTGAVPDMSDAGIDQQLCSLDQTTLDASPLSVGTGTWKQISGPGITELGNLAMIAAVGDPKTQITSLGPGNYEFSWTSSNGGCSFSDVVTITVFEQANSVEAGTDQTLGEFEIVRLNADPTIIGEGSWTQISGPTLANFIAINDPQTSVLGTEVGVYVFEWTIANGICNPISDQVTITFEGSSDLELTKEVYPEQVQAGDTVTFTISVYNNETNGSADATGVSIVDMVPSGYLVLPESISSNGVQNEDQSIVWSNLVIANGAAFELSFQAIVNVGGKYTNSAEVVASDQQDRDSNPGNKLAGEDDQDTAAILTADLSLEKTASASEAVAADTVTFTLTITNEGDEIATGVGVQDMLPIGFGTITNISDLGVHTESNMVVWSGLTVLPSESIELSFDAIVQSYTGGLNEYLNRAEIIASDLLDPDSTPNNSTDVLNEDDEASFEVRFPSTDLGLTKSVNNANPGIGEQVVFSIRVSNLGDTNASVIGIEELLPSGYHFIAAQITEGSYDGVSNFWSIPILEAGNSATLELTVEVLKTGIYLNSVQLAYLDQIDLNDTNNRAEANLVPRCLLVYNKFSPNGDGVNDLFKIDCLSDYPNNVLTIFDRWGKKLYQTENYQNDWHGISEVNATVNAGETLPEGTYYYSLDLGDGSKPIVDWLYLKH